VSMMSNASKISSKKDSESRIKEVIKYQHNQIKNIKMGIIKLAGVYQEEINYFDTLKKSFREKKKNLVREKDLKLNFTLIDINEPTPINREVSLSIGSI
jgi:hypothetical protein